MKHLRLLIAVCLVLLAACQPARSEPPAPATSAATPGSSVPAFKHIFLIVMENKEQNRVIGSADAPYFNQLAQQYASASEFYGTTHPSLPNYLALIGGDTFGVISNCNDCFQGADNLASQMKAAGRSWKAYMEDVPGPCFLGDSPPLYAQKHNPFIYFDSVRNDPQQCGQIVPLMQLKADLQANAIPDFVWITPNLCSDMHDCPVRTGDDWLQAWVPQILATQAWQDEGVLFITFDEGESGAGCCTYAQGGKIATLVISPLGKPGFVSAVKYNHYSLLRTIETAWGLPLLGHADCDCTPLMADFFASQ